MINYSSCSEISMFVSLRRLSHAHSLVCLNRSLVWCPVPPAEVLSAGENARVWTKITGPSTSEPELFPEESRQCVLMAGNQLMTSWKRNKIENKSKCFLTERSRLRVPAPQMKCFHRYRILAFLSRT